MADIFISYSRKDVARVQVLATALSAHGWSVWWDRQIRAGRLFDQDIADALAAARAVVVVWSKDAIASNWVRDEAEDARRREILIPVLIDEERPPLGFGRIQAVDLADWNGLDTADAFQKLITDITAIIGPPARPGQNAASSADEGGLGAAAAQGHTDDAAPRSSGRRGAAVRLLLTAVLSLTLLAFGVYRVRTGVGASQPRPITGPSPESALRLNAVMTRNGEPLADGVTYEVYEAAKDVEGQRKRVANSPPQNGPPRFPLPAGRYHVTASYGNASASTEVAVRAATLTVQTLNLRAGILSLSSVLTPGSEPLTGGVSYGVSEAAKDVEGNRKRVVGSPDWKGAPRFPLPAGRYYVSAAYGNASAGDEVDITAGVVKPHTLNFAAGILNLSSILAPGTAPLTEGVSYEVAGAAKDAAGNRPHVVGSPAFRGPPRFPLPAGRYYVSAAYGNASASSDVDVAAGKIKPLTLDFQAGILELSSVLAPGSAPLADGVSYEVYQAAKDAGGKRTHLVGSPKYRGPPRFQLPAGPYHVTAASKTGKADADVSVTAGQMQTLRLQLRPATER